MVAGTGERQLPLFVPKKFIDVLELQNRVLAYHIIRSVSVTHQLEYELDGHASAFDSRLALADLRINRYSLEVHEIRVHQHTSKCYLDRTLRGALDSLG